MNDDIEREPLGSKFIARPTHSDGPVPRSGRDAAVYESCDGFCPECGQKRVCKAYPELEDQWNWICS
jgi:hypothetical protein